MIDPETYFHMLNNDDTMHFAAAEDNDQLRRYDGGIYVPYGVAAIRKKIMKMTHGAGVSKHRVGEIVALMTWNNYVDRDAFDADPNVINMDNGLYHIDTGISPHTPKYLSLHKSPIVYNPEAECPNIDKFIDEVVPEADRHIIYEIGGYALSPHKNLKRAFIFTGEKNSGKSVMIALLEHLVGSDATTNVSPLTVSNTTYGAAEYYGKQLNLVDDLGNTPIMDTGILKSVIAGGKINAKFLYAQPFDYKPNVLCVFATNEVPKIEPFDEAYASRFSIIQFPNLFEGADADPDLIAKLTTPSELSGFFNKCMYGLACLNAHKEFTNDRTLADRIETYKYLASPVERFLDEMCDFDDADAYVLKDTLHIACGKWAQDNHVTSPDMGELTVAIRAKLCGIKLVTTDDNERKRAYIGVDFKHRVSDFA